jgi:hypothetical protein
MSENTRYWANLIHEHRLRSEGAIEHAATKMTDAGWHPESMPMMFLRADIAAMRKTADILETKLAELTKQEAA